MKNKFIPYENNIGLRILYDRIGNKIGVGISTFLFFFIIPFCIMLTFSYIENTLFLPGENVGFLEDIPIIELMLIFSIVIYIAYIFFKRYSKVPLKLQKLIDTKQFSENEYQGYLNNLDSFIEGEGKWFKYKIIFHIICLVVTLYFVLIYAHYNIIFPSDVWRFSTHPVNFIVFSSYQIIIGGYFIPIIFWRLFAIVYSLNNIFKMLSEKNALKSIPLSPDRAGGLKFIGELALTFHSILILPLFHIVLSVYLWGLTEGSLIGIIIYPPIVIVMFFLSIKNTHKIMKETKEINRNQIYKNITEYYTRSIKEKYKKKSSTPLEDYIASLEMMTKLKTYYQIADEMPVWPFDLSILGRFLISIFFPISLVVIQVILR